MTPGPITVYVAESEAFGSTVRVAAHRSVARYVHPLHETDRATPERALVSDRLYYVYVVRGTTDAIVR